MVIHIKFILINHYFNYFNGNFFIKNYFMMALVDVHFSMDFIS